MEVFQVFCHHEYNLLSLIDACDLRELVNDYMDGLYLFIYSLRLVPSGFKRRMLNFSVFLMQNREILYLYDIIIGMYSLYYNSILDDLFVVVCRLALKKIYLEII